MPKFHTLAGSEIVRVFAWDKTRNATLCLLHDAKLPADQGLWAVELQWDEIVCSTGRKIDDPRPELDLEAELVLEHGREVARL